MECFEVTEDIFDEVPWGCRLYFFGDFNPPRAVALPVPLYWVMYAVRDVMIAKEKIRLWMRRL